MAENDNPIGNVMGLPIPENASVQVGLHRLTGEQIDALIELAVAGGLPVRHEEHEQTRWVKIGDHTRQLTVFAPDNYYPENAMNEIVERKLAGKKFIQVAVPEGVSVDG